VSITAASVAFACSSSSSSAPPGHASDDASANHDTGSQLPSEAGSDDTSEDAPAQSTGPCDASIAFPADGGAGTACGACLENKCSSELGTCQDDCLCVTSIECLAVNGNNYTLCNDALSAIFAVNKGLTALAACITNSCPMQCNPQTD
jgi:hypothetical protein